ncbi:MULTISPECIES: shikimate kinase AroL [unclassified Arsenophonus]|uniref:shikimate kinase AroL n=1 Tax=unclassified Arsenophonus TaxID=2627083 RepID=UPI00285E387F|nr:shikimate kinase AroL [Arsenophonus sp.]MDR5610942.1 shikimate kinase AroL [Arsenophonus sp.]MDR5614842.1 shikimate kinase AroL [Arsenophonus sp.]
MLYLIGPRGAGKTTVGRTLAESRMCHFFDTDLLVKQNAKISIAELVERDGWDCFRDLESSVLRSIQQPNSVISTGGGIILLKENRDFMKKNGCIIYLQAPSDVLIRRLSADPEISQRPTLTGKPLAEEIAEVMNEREGYYLDTADYIIDADLPTTKIVYQIDHFLQNDKKYFV